MNQIQSEWVVFRIANGDWIEIDRMPWDTGLSREDVLRLFEGARGQSRFGSIKVRKMRSFKRVTDSRGGEGR